MNKAKYIFLSWVAAIVFFSMAGLLAGCQAAKVTGPMDSSGKELADQRRVGDYLIQTFSRGSGEGWAEITKAGMHVYRREGYMFQIGTMPDVVEHDFRRWLGKDITGLGKPDLILYEWTGGAHCDYIAYVIELGSPCRLLAAINGQHGVPCFRDMDGDGMPEVIIRDWTYAYWPVCFATAPAPQVILKWRNGKYELAAELIRTPVPSGNELATMALRTRKEWEKSVSNKYDRALIPQRLFQTALDLMYRGHEALGWQFIAMAWNPRFPMDNALIEELKRLMRDSDWWQAIQKPQTPSLTDSHGSIPATRGLSGEVGPILWTTKRRN